MPSLLGIPLMKKIIQILLFFSVFSSQAQNINFDAKGLLFLVDADMSAFSIMDGKLRKIPEVFDKVSTLTFPLSYGEPGQIQSDKASNSALMGQSNIAVSSDQKLVYVLESKGETAYNEFDYQKIEEDIPPGKYVTVVNIENLKSPKSLYRFPVGENPKSIALSPKDKYLAVTSDQYGKEIQVFELDETGKPFRIVKKPNNMAPGRIVELKWHSSGDYLVYINQDEAEMGIIKVLRDASSSQIIRLEIFGEPVKVGGQPSLGKFTPDEKFFLILDQKKNKTNIESSEKGEVYVLKLNLENEELNHFLLSRAEVGENPINFSIHPDGSHLIVSNLERSFYPPENFSSSGESSLSVLHLNFDGSLENIANYNIDGIFPSSAVFDKTGSYIAFCVYQYLTFGYSFGGIEFLKFDPQAENLIEAQKGKIYVPRGIHSMHAIHDY